MRVSYRAEWNFSEAHLLLLDASADVAIIEKTLARKVDRHQAEAPMRLRTVWMPGQSYSKSSLLPKASDTAEDKVRKAEEFVRIRERISTIAAMHTGGVLVVAAKLVWEELKRGWTLPANCGRMHFGATKGLNWASKYAAVITIGCIQPSAEAVDARVAALIYDQPDQEPMIDAIGANRGGDDPRENWALHETEIRMRSGRLITVKQRHPEHPLAAAAYEQVRRENSLQTIARVRPILRDEIPVYYCMGDYLPDSIIVDEVVPLDDITRHFGGALEAARRTGGYVGEGLYLEEDLAEAARTIAHLETNAVAATAFIRVDDAGETRWYPAYNADTVHRVVAETGAKILSMPEIREIGRPSTWDEDRDYHAARDDEAAARDAAIEASGVAGWRKERNGTRMCVWTQGETTLRLEMAVVLHLYRPPPEADNDDEEAVAAIGA